MKSINSTICSLIAFALLTVASSAVAGNSSTGGMPPRPPVWNEGVKFVIAHHAGFSPHPMNVTITITSNGRITREARNLDGSLVERKSLAVLASSVIATMADLGRQLDGQLVDENAGEPLCTDAPGSSYSFVESPVNGSKETTFFRRANCHDFMDQSGAAYELRRVLDGVDSISNLAR